MTLKTFPWVTLLSIFLSALGILLAVATILSYSGPRPLALCMIIGFFASALYYLLWYLPQFRRHHTFFGSSTNPLTVVVSSYRNRISYDPNDLSRKFRYVKTDPTNARTLNTIEGARDYLVGLATAKQAFRLAVELGRAASWQLNIIGDEEPNIASNSPLLCLGSPTSNSMSQAILLGIPGTHQIAFSHDTLSVGNLGEYTSDSSNDYAVVVRGTYSGQVAFVCAGIDEEGTVCALNHLVNNWAALRPQARNLPSEKFLSVLKCSKRDLGVSELSYFSW